MFSIFRRKKSGQGVESTQVRPVEQAGVDPLEQRLERTRSSLGGLFSLIRGASTIDEDLIEEIETTLLTADMGITATTRIIDRLREGIRRGIVSELAAGDTFRAAAVEQLKAWGERNGVPVVAQQSGADSAAVIFDALHSAKSRGVDVLIADTAGRLHTQGHLMQELAKVKRVMQKVDAEAPHETMLVVDAGTGQNALAQAREFNQAVSLSGITVTKLDGTARGGVMFAIAAELGIPIRFIGVGETAADLRPFDAGTFVHAILPVENAG